MGLLSVANFIGVTKAGVFVTPRSDTILASTTNQLLMEIARSKGITVEERPVDFEAEMGDFAEVGMCGTAAVVVRVESITRGETTYEFGSFATIASLRATLTGIQHGEIEDRWARQTPHHITSVPPVCCPTRLLSDPSASPIASLCATLTASASWTTCATLGRTVSIIPTPRALSRKW